MKTLSFFLAILVSNIYAQTKISQPIIGEWSTCGSWDLTRTMSFKKEPFRNVISTCTQKPCQSMCLDFNDIKVKLTNRTGCPGDLTAGLNDETMTWSISADNKILTLIKSDKPTEFLIIKLTSTDLTLKKK